MHGLDGIIYSFDGDNLINYFLSSGDAKGVDKIKYHHTRGIPAPLETNELIAGAIEREPKLPKPTKDHYYHICSIVNVEFKQEIVSQTYRSLEKELKRKAA